MTGSACASVDIPTNVILPRTPQHLDDVASHYDELDTVYRALWGEHVHHGFWRDPRLTSAEAVLALSDLVGGQLAFRPGDRLVDIGCGYGGTARRFASRGAAVTGFTLSSAQIAATPFAPGVTLYCRDWMENGLPAAAFEGAYAIESTEHMADKRRFFAEARRVLKPGGRLVVCAWLAAEHPSNAAVRFLLEPICREGRLPGMGAASDYHSMAEAAGLQLVEHSDISRQVRRTWDICLARFLRAFATEPAIRRIALTARNRAFALSVPRLVLAYRTGVMRYAVMTFVA